MTRPVSSRPRRPLLGVPVNLAARTPPPLKATRRPRLAAILIRRYLHACVLGGPERPTPLAGGRPEAALDESRRLAQAG
ncbi:MULTISPECIES: hypothetical protein [Streptomyces]|uniref:hypothetical protein n=1 Tax=Streptomyces TaxID=1883 RepID=UPI0012395662|nr:hypothetical protein [Streptomyces venezuelae]